MTVPKKGSLGIAEIIGAKRDAVLKLAEQYGATNVRVFGSVARGEAREDSDVDFLVEYKPGTSIFDAIELWAALKDLLERDVSLSTEDTLKDFAKPTALRELIRL
ncbi:MAG: nucleotidyltransferase family protein [Anaerolineae bacterium]|nr:nucleotidyltransferase family protein [Anaerolineae bacterium]